MLHVQCAYFGWVKKRQNGGELLSTSHLQKDMRTQLECNPHLETHCPVQQACINLELEEGSGSEKY
jgi:hypothetical protein